MEDFCDTSDKEILLVLALHEDISEDLFIRLDKKLFEIENFYIEHIKKLENNILKSLCTHILNRLFFLRSILFHFATENYNICYEPNEQWYSIPDISETYIKYSDQSIRFEMEDPNYYNKEEQNFLFYNYSMLREIYTITSIILKKYLPTKSELDREWLVTSGQQI